MSKTLYTLYLWCSIFYSIIIFLKGLTFMSLWSAISFFYKFSLFFNNTEKERGRFPRNQIFVFTQYISAFKTGFFLSHFSMFLLVEGKDIGIVTHHIFHSKKNSYALFYANVLRISLSNVNHRPILKRLMFTISFIRQKNIYLPNL